jgi:7-cyano-7-deazaguanine synthase
MAKGVVVLLSGGLDSTTLCAYMEDQRYEVKALTVIYGQRHRREILAAQKIAEHCRWDHRIVDLQELLPLLAGSSQTDLRVPVPHGHYADDTMRVTVVPNRNMLLLSVAAAYAISCGVKTIAYAAHMGDHAQYPDCRVEFITAMQRALRLCHYEPLILHAPFAYYSKSDIVRIGSQLGVPFGLTYSCYEGEELHCGQCGTCVERKEAFTLASVADPTMYKVP